jgi:hypothetical protein
LLIPAEKGSVVTVAMITAVMIVTVTLLVVGAMLRIERRFERRKPSAQSAEHILDHVIAPDAQPIADDLNVDVAIADVPGEPRKIAGIRRRDLGQRLGAADDPHHGAIVEHKPVAIVQSRGLRQIEQKPRATLAAQDNAAAVPLVGIERNGIDGARSVPVAGSFDFVRTLHA